MNNEVAKDYLKQAIIETEDQALAESSPENKDYLKEEVDRILESVYDKSENVIKNEGHVVEGMITSLVYDELTELKVRCDQPLKEDIDAIDGLLLTKIIRIRLQLNGYKQTYLQLDDEEERTHFIYDDFQGLEMAVNVFALIDSIKNKRTSPSEEELENIRETFRKNEVDLNKIM